MIQVRNCPILILYRILELSRPMLPMIIRLIDRSISMRGREAAQRYRLRRILQLKPTQLKEDQLCLQDLKKARLKQTSHQKLETRRRKSTESAHPTTAGA